jgi:hypothetical protein
MALLLHLLLWLASLNGLTNLIIKMISRNLTLIPHPRLFRSVNSVLQTLILLLIFIKTAIHLVIPKISILMFHANAKKILKIASMDLCSRIKALFSYLQRQLYLMNKAISIKKLTTMILLIVLLVNANFIE